MALTKVTGQVIKNTTDVTVGVLTVTNTLAVGGTVSIGGTLTYEDVTNVDAVGLVTARNGIVVGSGITLSKDGDVFFTGIATGNGSGLTALNASNIGSGTVPTARLGSGTASSSTFLRGDSTFAAVTSTTINSNADNRLITGSGTANTLNGEANLAFDGTGLGLVGHIDIRTGSSINTNVTGSSASGTLHKNTTSGQFAIVSGGTGGNNYLSFFTSASAAPTEKLRIHADGEVEIKEATAGQTVLSATALYSASSNVDIATFARSGGAVASAIRYADASTSMLFGTTTSHAFGVMTGGTERLRIKSDGKVGVGNASPTFLLDVKGATTDTFRISNSNETGHGDTDAKIVAGGSYYQNIRFEASKHKFITFDGSSTYERLRITSAGLVGIGENTPLAQLHIKPASNMSQLLLEQNNAGDGYALFQDGPNGGHLKFMRHVGGSETQRLLLRSDGGLCFGTDTAAANALDDYEEGTWTPTVNGTNSNLTHRASRYLKIGKLVQLQVEFYTVAGNFSTGTNFNLTNLPFSGPASPMHVVGSVAYMNSAYGMTLMTNYLNASSQWYFNQATGSGLYLWGNITYQTAS